jgi:predicted lipid-binding transport protein (Tim44 family)
MMNRFEKLNAIFILLLVLMASCSAPSENGEKANNNSAQPTSAATSEPPVAQSGTPTATSDGNVSTAQPPAPQSAPAQPSGSSTGDPSKPVEKAATATAAAKDRAPRLLVPDKKLDFGKQSQDKTLARTFRIKNVGNADLQIESVTPS